MVLVVVVCLIDLFIESWHDETTILIRLVSLDSFVSYHSGTLIPTHTGIAHPSSIPLMCNLFVYYFEKND